MGGEKWWHAQDGPADGELVWNKALWGFVVSQHDVFAILIEQRRLLEAFIEIEVAIHDQALEP